MYACLSLCGCANENDREKECYGEMNERNNIYISKSCIKKMKKKLNQFVALGVVSVALRHTLVYVWKTLSVPICIQLFCTFDKTLRNINNHQKVL